MSRFAQQNEFQVAPGLRLVVDSVISVGVVAGWTEILSSHCPSSVAAISVVGTRRFCTAAVSPLRHVVRSAR